MTSHARVFTDYGNAERLVDRHGADLRYVATWDKWLVWDGRRWTIDQTGEIVRRAKETVRAIYRDAATLETREAREEMAKHALRSEHGSRIREMIALARSEAAVARGHEAFDADPWRITVLNGTVNLRTGMLEPHDRAQHLTRLAPVEYRPEAACPRWSAFLDRVLGGDPELVAFVQRAVGYSLTGVTDEQCLFFLHGAGANGKSTFLEVLRRLMGEHAAQADFATFLERKHRDGPRNDIAQLAAARLVTSSELGEGRRLDESIVKSLTGGDTISARFLFQEAFEFRPQFKLWLAGNHKPVIRGTDEGIWRRIRLVPFTVQIPSAERDPRLVEALTDELPGILQWAIAGCLWWQRGGLPLPAVVQSATAEYRAQSDVLGAFLRDCTVEDPGAVAPSRELYAAYKRWCDEANERAATQTGFGNLLKERGFRNDDKGANHTRRWLGLCLVPRDDLCGGVRSNGSQNGHHREGLGGFGGFPGRLHHEENKEKTSGNAPQPSLNPPELTLEPLNSGPRIFGGDDA